MGLRLVNTPARSIITPAALVRPALGWGAFGLLSATGALLQPPAPALLLPIALLVIIAVILACAFGVVHEAERLADRLGDPYGSLVLTLSIVMIEVILICAVMLGPGEHATIARDSVTAVSMIILNLVIGLCLLAGGMRHGAMKPNRTGASAYLVMLLVLLTLAFGVPALPGPGGDAPARSIALVILTLGLYGFFLQRQMGAQAGDFIEADARVNRRPGPGHATRAVSVRAAIAGHRREILLRVGLLAATVLPIVLLSHDMAELLDQGLDRLGAPAALSGVLIAMIVFLPESITSIRAALQGQIQRVSNLCHGALLSTVGLTIPAVLVIGSLTGRQVILVESPANLVLLGASLLVTAAGFGAGRVTAIHGAAHLVLFAVYGTTLVS